MTTSTRSTACREKTFLTAATEVLIIGGGATGCGIMRDLSLQGIHCRLIDKQDLCAGASGGNHGLLHSGARYVLSDPQSAAECRREGAILKRIAPQCIEETGGLFVAVPGDDEDFIDHFPGLCAGAGIDCQHLAPRKARELEPQPDRRQSAPPTWCRTPPSILSAWP